MSKETKMDESGTGKWGCTLSIAARPSDVFSAFTDPRDIMRYTRAPAVVEAKEGGDYSIFDGSIHGHVSSIEKDKKLVLKWRFKSWAERVYSTVTIEIEDKGEGRTKVTFLQTGIPSEDGYGNRRVLDTTRDGWKGRIFKGIQQILGYGMDISDEI